MEAGTQQGLLPPVRHIRTDGVDERPDDAIALCLSGGGYRAMLFHLGALWRLNQLGYLRKLARISSVSGGSITAAVLGRSWGELGFGSDDISAHFEELVVTRVRHLASRTIDWRVVVMGLLLPGTTVNARLASAYSRHLFGSETLQALPRDGPLFVINATNLQSGAIWRFTRPFMRDWRVGKIEEPTHSLAAAVAASSAFPPVLSPARPRFSEGDYVPGSGDGCQEAPFTTRPVLTDGGVYDNLGLETAWKRCRTVLVSDGGGQFVPQGKRWLDWGRQAFRAFAVIDSQVRSLRKRQVIASYKAPVGDESHRRGTYWGIRSHVADYDLEPVLDCPPELTGELAETPTRLARLDSALQERLINWGYAICDTAMRRWVAHDASPPADFPYPRVGVG
jgi:NTE family protein